MNKYIYKTLRKIGLIKSNQMFREHCWRNDAWMVDEYNLPELTDDEVKQFRDIWPCFSVDKRDLSYIRMYKSVFGFDPYFMPDFQFYEYLIKQSNPTKLIEPFKNKALYDIYLPKIPTPEIICRSISGIKYDREMKQLNQEHEVSVLINQNKFVIKPSIDTGCGKGVRIVELPLEDKEKFVNDLLSEYGRDYVIQKVVEQHSTLANLNPTSLNTCRVTTIYLNGKISSSTILKVGKLNSDKDNWFTSYFIGVDDNGVVLNRAFDAKLKRVSKTDTGVELESLRLPKFKEMVNIVECCHQYYFPNIGVLGWDVCVDKDNNIIVIEVNVDYPGIAGEQFASGTFFKSRRNDIVDYLNR